jgi:DNA-binding transcriptional LysR family regulator
MSLPASLLPELPALLAIAEECHFGRAAERLNVSQSRVSQLVRRIEDIVGYPIFIRRPQVRLTKAGELLTKAARVALRELDVAVARAGDAAAGRAGKVRLGYAPVAMLTRLPAVLKSYRARNPGVELQLHTTYSADLWSSLESRQLDLIVSREARVRPGIHSHLFARDSLVAALPEGDPAASQSELPLSSLRDRDFVTIDEAIAPQWHHTITSMCRSAGFEPCVVQRANDWGATLALISSGLGVSIVSSTLAQLRFPGIKFVPLAEAVGVGSFWIAHHEKITDPAVAQLQCELIGPQLVDDVQRLAQPTSASTAGTTEGGPSAIGQQQTWGTGGPIVRLLL